MSAPTRGSLLDLVQIVGRDNALSAREDLVPFAADAKVEGAAPALVLFPREEQQVCDVLRYCSQRGLPVVPRGAATGTIGGAIPEFPGAVVLSLERMNRIVEINARDGYAEVEPGVVCDALKAEARAHGLFYPPDPASADTSTVGGNASTNAGGLRAVKYGVTRDYVLGLHAVLSSGELIRTGVRTRKGVMGYDLTRLLVGSEGTLAVITRLILRLAPAPESVLTLSASFAGMEQAGEAVVALMQGRVLPAALELMDRASLEVVQAELAPGCEALLLIDCDGETQQVQREIEQIERLMQERGALQVEVARDQAQSERLWKARRSISPAIYKIKSRKFAEDVTVPISRIPELLRRVADAAAQNRVLNVNYGHAGDGNIHVNVLFDPDDQDERARAEQTVQQVFRITLELGGTLSGEHGVGLAKREALRLEIDPTQIELQRRIKAAFDPAGILNPGKGLPPR
ncbi:MAG: FAD-linked oxidase C-terminal domain-containing protein [Candidatus Alcyoniella australis]|nr:FAD-linked oxidase C-terminal domain-containing protein [Candidatus Alcyoniella australis]